MPASDHEFVEKVLKHERAKQQQQPDLETIVIPSVSPSVSLQQRGAYFTPTCTTTYKSFCDINQVVERMRCVQKKFNRYLRREKNPLYALVDRAKDVIGIKQQYPTIAELFSQQLQNVDELNNNLEGILSTSRTVFADVQKCVDQFREDEKTAEKTLGQLRELRPPIENEYARLIESHKTAGSRDLEGKHVLLERKLREVNAAERAAAEQMVVSESSRKILYGIEKFFDSAIEMGERVLKKSRAIQITYHTAAGVYQQTGDIFKAVGAIANKLECTSRYTEDVHNIMVDGLRAIGNLHANIGQEVRNLLVTHHVRTLSSSIPKLALERPKT